MHSLANSEDSSVVSSYIVSVISNSSNVKLPEFRDFCERKNPRTKILLYNVKFPSYNFLKSKLHETSFFTLITGFPVTTLFSEQSQVPIPDTLQCELVKFEVTVIPSYIS